MKQNLGYLNIIGPASFTVGPNPQSSEPIMNTEETTKRITPIIGNVYFLKNYTAPKVFTGHHFECALTHQYLTSNIKILQDLGPLKDWPHEVWRPERFNGLGIEAKSPEAESRGLASDSPAERQPPDNQLLPQETTTQNMKTPTLAEIKDQVAQEAGYQSWESLAYDFLHVLQESPERPLARVAKLYAQHLIEADRKDCAEKAKTTPTVEFCPIAQMRIRAKKITVDQDSILNRPLPKMQ